MTEVLEGEVIDTRRKRDRNTIRSVGGLEVLPPDVETKVVALRSLPVESQVSAVTAMLAHSKAGLLTAIAAQDLPSIKDWKAKAGAVQKMAQQLQLGKDLQLDSAEFVRRAERGLGVAIRDGQASGTIETQSEQRARAGRARHSAHGCQPCAEKPKATDYASPSDLAGSGAGPGYFDLADGIPDEDFEQALADARSEANISRANVAKKLGSWPRPKAESDPRVATELPPTKVRTTTKARKTIELLAVTLSNLALGVADVDPAEVDREQLQVEIDSIDLSLGEIRGFIRKVNKQ